jgi:hypothetical protein
MVKNGLVYGECVNDADYVTCKRIELPRGRDGKRRRKRVWSCPYFDRWSEMLRRVYKSGEKHPTYVDVSVCDEWKVFSNFKRWVDEQPEREWEVRQLDKDILVEGNKLYSPKTCVFVNKLTNSFIVERGNDRGEYMLGVNKVSHKSRNSFYAQCSDPLKRNPRYLGYFDTELEAHLAWKARKHEYALELAEMESDPRVREVLRTKYL